MGSVRCTLPVPHPTNLPVLEAKVDHLAHQLDEFLYRGIGACSICSACSLHNGQRESTEEQLKAQSRLLENLERRIDVMQKSLDGLINVLETKQPNTYQGGAQAPPTEPTNSKAFLPAKTSLVTSEGKIPSQLEKNRHQDKKQTISNKAELRDSAGPEAGQQWVVGYQHGIRSHPMAEESHRWTENYEMKEGSQNQGKTDSLLPSLGTVSLPLVTKKAENRLNTNQWQDTKQPCTAPVIKVSAGMGAVQRGCVRTSEGPKHPGGNQKEESLRQSETKPEKQSESAVRLASMDNTSTHVHSCPSPFKRLQTLGAKPLFFGSARDPAQVETCREDNLSAACGVRIRVDPADNTTQSPLKICNKIIDDVPPQPAPFLHRVVALQTNSPLDTFIIHTREVLGSGRFGKVHRCTEISSGLELAVKIINTRTAKEKERANNEVQAMNQLSHPNILQLYEAFEAKHQLVLILELVQGGELFDRIVDESSPLTEVDAMVFVKQICEGVSYMHQMYVLHLDLKPENILCVNRTGHQVKIIDFGLARRYRPREKLRVNFGTTEFLAPEVVNFDFVSFPTDMWTLGVVTYMLLSGLSPFLGDDETQTLNNVLSTNCSFDHEAFKHISADAKEFITHLLVKDKGGRMSAAQCLRHPWLNNIAEKAKEINIVLKSQVLLKKYLAKRLWKKNYIAVTAANRLKNISSAGELSSLDMDTLPVSTE